jgi:hypothetical protein
MNELEASNLRPNDYVIFNWRRIPGKTIRGTVLSIYPNAVRIEWDDDWIGVYEFDNMDQITLDTEQRNA